MYRQRESIAALKLLVYHPVTVGTRDSSAIGLIS
jgi:hypothetical protein